MILNLLALGAAILCVVSVYSAIKDAVNIYNNRPGRR